MPKPKAKQEKQSTPRTVGVKMETALDESECTVVREFLATLCTAHKKHGKLDVGKFLKEYSFNLNGDYSKGRNQRNDKFWTQNKVVEAQAMRRSGEKWKVIADNFGVTQGAVMQAVKMYGELN